jgi:hypothetical protein
MARFGTIWHGFVPLAGSLNIEQIFFPSKVFLWRAKTLISKNPPRIPKNTSKTFTPRTHI